MPLGGYYAAESFAKGGTAMFAILALAGDFGCSFGPTVVGVVSELLGDNLKQGVFSAVIFPIILIIIIILLGKNSRKKSAKKT